MRFKHSLSTVTTLAVAGTLVFGVPSMAPADELVEVYDDGGEHDFAGGTAEEPVTLEVRNNTADNTEATTLHVLSPAIVAWLETFDTSLANVSEGTTFHGRIVANDESAVYIQGGSIPHRVTAFDNSVIEISGGEIEDVYARHSGTVNISGGTLGTGDRIRAREEGLIEITGGTFVDEVRSENEASVVISGGVFEDRLEGRGSGHFQISDGTFEDRVWGDDDSVIEISGGNISEAQSRSNSTMLISGGTFSTANRVLSRDSSTMEISGGTFESHVRSDDTSTMRIVDGTFEAGVEGRNESLLEISGGSLGRVTSRHDGLVQVSGGDVVEYRVQEDSVTEVSGGTTAERSVISDQGTFRISGGTFNERVTGEDTALVEVSGGSFHSLRAADQGTVSISGGTVENAVEARGDGVLEISGGDLQGGLLLRENVSVQLSAEASASIAEQMSTTGSMSVTDDAQLNLGTDSLEVGTFSLTNGSGTPTLGLTVDDEQQGLLIVTNTNGLTLDTFNLALDMQVELDGGTWTEGADILLATYQGDIQGDMELADVAGIASHDGLHAADGELTLLNVHVIPEPGVAGLVLAGGALLLARRRHG